MTCALHHAEAADDADDDVAAVDAGEVEQFVAGQEIVAGYRAWGLLGSGPRCETWMAWSERLRVPVALKIPRYDMNDHPSPRVALTREVEALRRVVHPFFPRLLDADLAGAVPFMATEYIEGPTLACTVEDDGPFTAIEVALVGVQIAIALGHLHDLGLVHHDVKPHNVMLRDGRITLIDLGFVQRCGVPPLPGGPRGTESYMAPEQRRGENNTASSDIYSLGLLLLELLTGAVDADMSSATGWFTPRLHEARQNLDAPGARLVEAIERLTADHPGARPQNCAETIALLNPVLSPTDVPWPDFVDYRCGPDAPPAPAAVPSESVPPIPWVATWTSEASSARWPRSFDEALDAKGSAVDDHELVEDAERYWPIASRTVWEMGGTQGEGEPIFNRLHPARQRQAMLEGRCSVCGQLTPAPWTFLGNVADDGRTPAFREPPLCERCLPRALAACPGLRRHLAEGQLSAVTVTGYMPVPDLADADDPHATVEHLLAIPVMDGWRIDALLVDTALESCSAGVESNRAPT